MGNFVMWQSYNGVGSCTVELTLPSVTILTLPWNNTSRIVRFNVAKNFDDKHQEYLVITNYHIEKYA